LKVKKWFFYTTLCGNERTWRVGTKTDIKIEKGATVKSAIEREKSRGTEARAKCQGELQQQEVKKKTGKKTLIDLKNETVGKVELHGRLLLSGNREMEVGFRY